MITTSLIDTTLVVRITVREAGLKVAEQFKQNIFDLLDEGHPYLIIDFEEVTYVDSSFLGALVSGLKYALFKESDIALVNLHKDILGLFELIRMDKVFTIYSNLQDAVSKNKKR